MNDSEREEGRLAKKIALCLSGGGYRAAGFHLGTLDYLEHLGLLPNVTMLSTVSGGTFIGTAFTVSLVEKDPFVNFFRACYTFIRDQRYIGNILQFLGTERPDRPGKRRNMIQAAAELYANSFLKDEKTGRPYLLGTILDSDIPLTAIFNATSFYSGESFVFQKGQKVADFVGNLHAHISRDDARNTRLGDIAAASSCFPGGFEPLAFPQDFVWPGEVPALQQYRTSTSEELPETIPLMDGGVADNVGLLTLIQAIPAGQDDLDLIIASDADTKPIDLYKDFPLKPKASSFWQKESRMGLTIDSLHWLIIAFVAFLALTMIGQGIYTWRQISGDTFRLSSLFFYLVALLLSTVIGGGLLWIRRLFRQNLLGWFDEKMGEGKRRSWDVFKHLTLGQAINMVKLRVSSLYAMTSNIFMRCIRDLTYVITQYNPEYSERFVPDMIYAVKDQQRNFFFKNYFSPLPSDKLLRVVDAIVNMESTLWWQKDYQLPSLVACGQISLCLSLFTHYYNSDQTDPGILKLLDTLHEDWKKLNDNPFYLLEQRYPHLKPFPFPPDVKS